ncbi:hypothetical protein BGX31_006902 [Mortierella sp. GBA43]|nr:hypothetical protein BGX31_006902 [Mortierella sp. GBA43]
MKDLLDRCSSTLENLYVDVSVHVNEDRKAAKEHVDAGSKGHNDWTSLRKLSLQVSNSNPDSMALCAWLWKRCSHVERLEIWEADGAVSSLVEGMMNSMDNLNEIILGERLGDTAKVTDFEVAALLSGSRKGWKVVRVGNAANFKEAAMGALVKHFPTLEEFISSGCNDIACENLVQVLSSCPNLHTLVDAYEDASLRDSRLHASTFIDLDYTTGTYRTWACESSLRAFKVKVAGIPRPGLRGAWVVKETYPGEGQLMQDLVYGRLARLTNLETLWLGMRPYEAYAFLKKPMKIQSDCVEMSLESGLHRLSGLKKLKELSVTDDPDNEANNTEAATWLRQHHPEIELRNM